MSLYVYFFSSDLITSGSPPGKRLKLALSKVENLKRIRKDQAGKLHDLRRQLTRGKEARMKSKRLEALNKEVFGLFDPDDRDKIVAGETGTKTEIVFSMRSKKRMIFSNAICEFALGAWFHSPKCYL